MKRFGIIFFAPALFLASCGGDEKTAAEEAAIVLKTHKDTVSYVLGGMYKNSVVGGQDPNIAKLDMQLVSKGFNENLDGAFPQDCQATLKQLFGPNKQDFNEKYAKEGALCLGRITGYSFYQDMKRLNAMSEVDLKMVRIGFKHGILKIDTLLTEPQKQAIIGAFIAEVNEANGKKMMAKARKIPGAKVFDNGVVIQVIKEGTGGYPSATDDVKVEYILTSAVGDTVQDSYKMKKERGTTDAVALQLNGGVIPGWSFAIPKMKKGGTYRLYLPWDLAYGEEAGRESLCFVIELVDYAKQGTFVKPDPNTAIPGN
jgi:FKBP-type peptidyl-prolyl cis-trans isomerase